MTKAQKWARERNGAKFLLKGIAANLKSISMRTSLLTTERSKVRRAVLLINEILGSWKGRNTLSKKKFMEGNK